MPDMVKWLQVLWNAKTITTFRGEDMKKGFLKRLLAFSVAGMMAMQGAPVMVEDGLGAQ